MNAFDELLLRFLNDLADRSPWLVRLIQVIYEDDLKGAFPLALICWAWVSAQGTVNEQEVHEKIMASYVGFVITIVAVRVITMVLPFRVRPINLVESGLHFQDQPFGWMQWSAFPSDTAALFIFLATCLLSISPLLGSLALLDAVFLISFPRVFLGIHYPTDILAGAVIGVAGGYWATRPNIRAWLARPGILWMQAHPPSFYAMAFLLAFLVARIFWPLQRIALGAVHVARIWTAN
jgi:undecaprenyl-diphosphatase